MKKRKPWPFPPKEPQFTIRRYKQLLRKVIDSHRKDENPPTLAEMDAEVRQLLK